MLPRKCISFHCSDSESNKMNVGNNEVPEKSSKLPRVDEAESIAVEELEASKTKNMAVLEVFSRGALLGRTMPEQLRSVCCLSELFGVR